MNGRLALLIGAVVVVSATTSSSPLRARADGATTLYVAPTGCSDSNPGDQARPFCTVVKAAKVARAGTTVVVASGTYGGDVRPWYGGTSTLPIVYTAAPGAQPILEGGQHSIVISNLSWISVTGFTMQNSTGSSVFTNNANGLNVSGNTVESAGHQIQGQNGQGLYINATTASTFSGNVIADNSADGIYVTGGSTGNAISGNDIYGNAYGWQRNAAGIDLKAPGNIVIGNRTHHNEDSGIEAYPGGDNSVITDNVSYNNRGYTTTVESNCSRPYPGSSGCLTGDHGIDNYQVSGGYIVANTVYGNTSAGINVEGGLATVPTNYTIANNISVDNATACPDGAGGVVKCPRSKGDIRVDQTSTLGTTLDYDLLFNSTPGHIVVFGTVSYDDLASLTAGTAQEAHGIEADPLLTDPAAGDLRPTEGSPAIDSADSAAPQEPTTDQVGSARWDDPLVANTGNGLVTYADRGAMEYVDTAPLVGGEPVTGLPRTASIRAGVGTASAQPTAVGALTSAGPACRTVQLWQDVARSLRPGAGRTARSTGPKAQSRAIAAHRLARSTADINVLQALQLVGDDLTTYRAAMTVNDTATADEAADQAGSAVLQLRRACR